MARGNAKNRRSRRLQRALQEPEPFQHHGNEVRLLQQRATKSADAPLKITKHPRGPPTSAAEVPGKGKGLAATEVEEQDDDGGTYLCFPGLDGVAESSSHREQLQASAISMLRSSCMETESECLLLQNPDLRCIIITLQLVDFELPF